MQFQTSQVTKSTAESIAINDAMVIVIGIDFNPT